MKILNTMCAFALAALLGACSVTHTDDVVATQTQKGGIMGLATQDDVKVNNAKAFAGRNEVVIGNFAVAFLESKKGSKKAGGGLMGGFGGRSTANMDMKGLDTQTMQQITNDLYADFVAKLQSNGYTVVNRDALLNSDFGKTAKSPSPMREEESFLGADADITFVSPSGFDGIRFFAGDFGKSGGIGLSTPTNAAGKYASDTGIPVLSVTYTVDFAATDGHGGTFSRTSSVQIGQVLSIAPESGVNFIAPTPKGVSIGSPHGSVRLGQAVASKKPIGKIQNTTSDAHVAIETATNIIGTLAGVGSNQSRNFEITVDPAQYKSAANEVGTKANTMLIAKMASSK